MFLAYKFGDIPLSAMPVFINEKKEVEINSDIYIKRTFSIGKLENSHQI